MNIKGKHVLPTDIKTLWPLLQDAEVLARISPGVSDIRKLGEDEFQAISQVSIGPVRGSFEGKITLKDKGENETMTLVLAQKSKIGNAEASIIMNLAEEGHEQTLLTYTGTAKISGKLATMGQRIIGGVISTLSKQVFKELEKIIKERNTAEASINAGNNGSAVATSTKVDTPNISKLEASSNEKKTFLQSILDFINSLWK
ncbi:MAG: carbon monoxide dehydrogenase subunit G [Saprospiraceae bacterium]|jgi:carbon monoxide dehydrogenase subunit G